MFGDDYMFYESDNSLSGTLIKTESNNDFSFPLHLHSSFELITVTKGEMTVTVDKKQYTLICGQALLIFPNEVHSLHTENHSSHFLCIFSEKLVQAYGNVFNNKRPENHLFTPDKYLLDSLLELQNNDDLLKIKGILYCLCSQFNENAVYSDRHSNNADLLFTIFKFVEANYNKNCSLEALSETTAYHSVYLSRYFKKCTGMTYTDYVNRYRINEAGYILRNSDKNILQIAYDCGFDSLRSFNRNFKLVTGLTPTQYRDKQ